MSKESRRRALLRAMAAGGSLGVAGISGWISAALASGDLPATAGVNRLEGSATVNGKAAKVGTPVNMGDRVSTGAASQAVIVLKGDAFLLRANTVIEVQGREGVLANLLINSGRVLAVFSKKPVGIKAGVASIGIRGTGAYLEVEPKSVYFCLCYGEATIEGRGMGQARTVKTEHHEQPLMLRDDGAILRVEPGPFLNHSDDELILLESLVGREPPFTKGAQYPQQRY